MTEEEMLKQTREFMKKLNSRPMPESVKWEIERLEAIESGEYEKTPEARADVARLCKAMGVQPLELKDKNI
ncbi:MAG: hypothetical protein Q612_NSC00306G0002 [Negativicoccus succinicivorans DORA_17_25]|uniref:Uncharacterized protein n=2 Tax=Negativicoccus succinicivorans TaxID=620903 RepID=W1TXQ8_9FIRM|nr:MAG: hypothetical protein Q612_NSC00306G0002 [Negativicoccus succinicivorans DORA_17_25]MDU2184097.1 hypothetical protein [Negativicoccus succinicivorans]